MTEITFHRKTLLATLDAILTQFDLASSDLILETEPSGDRFILVAKRKDLQDVRAFGPCQVKGNPVSVEFDINDLQTAIVDAHQTDEAENVTLLVGDGLWVKDPVSRDEG